MEFGTKLTLNVAVNNSTLPISRIDKRLNAGSLVLLDFSHSLSNSTIIPTNGSTIKNLASFEATTLLSTSEANISPIITNTTTTNGMKLEFTGKKGLHGIVSQVNDIDSGNDFTIKLPDIIRDYIYNNISRGFFISIWDRKTRLATTASTSIFNLGLNTTSNYINAFTTGGGNMKGSNIGGRFSTTSLNSLSPQINNSAVSVITGTVTNSSSENLFKFGSFGAYRTLEVNKACSNILYQLHIVDIETARVEYNTLNNASLTTAQMYSVLDTADLANWTYAFSSIGRFYNDTFTDPATFA